MILVVVASGDFFSDYGGGQVYVHNLVDELVHRQNACESNDNTPHNETIATNVISFNKNGHVKISDYKGINVYQVNDESSFRKAVVQIKPDIVHANGEKLLTARICKELNIPCIVTAHHGGLVCPAGTLLNTNDEICSIPADYSHCLKCYLRNTPTGLFWYPLLKKYSQKHYCRIGERLEKLPPVPFLTPIGRTGIIVTKKLNDWKELAASATHFIAPSDAIADAMKRNGCPTDKITIIPHGIPSNISPSTPAENSQVTVRNSLPIKFYYVGRINYVKGIHILLQSFHSIDNPDIQLHLIGGTGNKAEQRYEKKLKRKYHRDNRIVWHGKLPYNQMEEAVREYHCLIHPAIYLEVFGLNISEALAQHKYVIATRCGGAEMQITNESEGLLVEPNDTDSLRSSIESFIANPHLSTANHLTIEQHVDRLLKCFHSAISGHT